jgi:GNAT superfamily N-acetyltransferase
MSDITIRSATDMDHAQLLAAIADEQDYERALHDTRKPGSEIAGPYLAHLRARVARNRGLLLVAERDRVFAGYTAGWIENEDNVAETADSNCFGYIADTYVVPELRGRGVAAALIAAAESHLLATGTGRMRIRVLADNASALRAYEKSGFVPYEIVLEKRLG